MRSWAGKMPEFRYEDANVLSRSRAGQLLSHLPERGAHWPPSPSASGFPAGWIIVTSARASWGRVASLCSLCFLRLELPVETLPGWEKKNTQPTWEPETYCTPGNRKTIAHVHPAHRDPAHLKPAHLGPPHLGPAHLKPPHLGYYLEVLSCINNSLL